jgi:hypothetical protein
VEAEREEDRGDGGEDEQVVAGGQLAGDPKARDAAAGAAGPAPA